VAVGVVAIGAVVVGMSTHGVVQALAVPAALMRRRTTRDSLYREFPTVPASSSDDVAERLPLSSGDDGGLPSTDRTEGARP
jgi:hypothetical protein